MHLPFLVNFPWYNNCSLFFWLSKCGEIMLFGVVFIEKNTKKQKKKQHFWKSFISYLDNGSTLAHNSNWFSKLQCRATTFVFYHFRQLVMWPPSQHPIGWTLIDEIICILFFFTLLVRSGKISFWGYMQRTLIWTFNAVPDDVYTILLDMYSGPTLTTTPNNTNHHFFLMKWIKHRSKLAMKYKARQKWND